MENIKDGSLPVFTKELARQLEDMDQQAATESIQSYFKAAFPEWRKNPAGNIPIAVLDSENMQAIGAKSKIALLSADTMKKQDAHHPELTQTDYERAQEVIENGETFQQAAKKLAIFTNSIAAIIKAANAGDEVYLVSMYRMSSDKNRRKEQIKTLRKKKD